MEYLFKGSRAAQYNGEGNLNGLYCIATKNVDGTYLCDFGSLGILGSVPSEELILVELRPDEDRPSLHDISTRLLQSILGSGPELRTPRDSAERAVLWANELINVWDNQQS